MARIQKFQALVHTSQKTPTSTSVKAVRLVLQGKHNSIAEAFAFDKEALKKISSHQGDPISKNMGFMAGKLRHR